MSCQDGIYNVKAYGATGNGTTDDAVFIQAAITACTNNGGGIVFFPSGRYKTTATLIIASTVATIGMRIVGSGSAPYNNPQGGTRIETYFNGDVFSVGSGGTDSISFESFTVDRGFSVPTSGSTFKIASGSGISFSNVTTFDAYDDFTLGTAGSTALNQFLVFNCKAFGTRNTEFHIVGGCAGIQVKNSFFGGNASGSCMVFDMPAGNTVDVVYISKVDFETFSSGIIATMAGSIADYFLESVIIDAATASPCINFAPAAGGSIARGKMHNCWFSMAGAFPCVKLSAGANSGSSAGIDELIVSNCNISGSNTAGMYIGDGTRDVVVSGCTIYGCGTGAGINILGTNTTRGITIAGNKISNVYGNANNNAILINPSSGATSDRITIVGNDLSGSTAQAIVLNFTPGTISNVLIEGNNLVASGSNPPISWTGTPPTTVQLVNNLGYNPIGLQSAPGIPATNVVLTNPFPFAADVTITANAGGGCIVTKNGTILFTIAASGFQTIRLGVGETIALTYASAPTWIWMGE